MPNTLVLSTGANDVIERGDPFQFSLTVFSNNALTTPTSYSLIYYDPQNAQTTVAKANITVASTGVLTYSAALSLTGTWRYTFTTTTPTGRASGYVTVIDNAGTN